MDVMEPLDPSRRGAADLSFVAPSVASISGLGSYGPERMLQAKALT